jgi:hypothetical protein
MVGAVKCEVCGTVLPPSTDEARTTSVVDSKPSDSEPSTFDVKPNDIPERTLALYLMNRDKPIILPCENKVMVGRFDSEPSMPAVNLAPFKAQRLGVSRKHAVIRHQGDSYSIVDLDSTNGTWINNQRLQPYESYALNSMDELRLGSLKMLVFFQRKVSNEVGHTQISRLRLASRSGAHLTVDYMESTIIPYLKAVSALQQIYDELLQQGSSSVEIEAISHRLPIMIHMRGARQAVDLIEGIHRKLTRVASGIGSDSDERDTLILSQDGKPVSSGTSLTTQPLSNEVKTHLFDLLEDISSEHIDLNRPNQEILVQLTMQVLNDIASDLAEADKLVFAVRLLPVIQTIMDSDLTILVED